MLAGKLQTAQAMFEISPAAGAAALAATVREYDSAAAPAIETVFGKWFCVRHV